MAGTSETPRARALGAEIRHAREAAGVGFRELARRLDISHSALSHWESGRRPPSPEDVAGLLGILNVTGEERDRLLELARDASDPNWVTPGLDKQLAALIEYERTATRITEVNPLLVPGLLQTGDYARAIMRAAGATRGEADHRAMVRIGRREVLEREEPAAPEFHALIGEYAFRYPACEASVMAAQARHLLRWAQRDNITIQVVPMRTGWTPMHSGAFILMEFARARPVIHLEHYRSSLTLTDGGDGQDYQAAADMVRRAAMSPDDTAALIADVAKRLETGT